MDRSPEIRHIRMSNCCIDSSDYIIELLSGNKTEALDFNFPRHVVILDSNVSCAAAIS